MIVYWSLFLAPAIGALQESAKWRRHIPNALIGVSLFLFIIIAFRETGGDWPRYLVLLSRIQDLAFFEALLATDPLYGALNWISDRLGLGIYGVNAACAISFLVAFAHFTAREPRPLLMMTVATPYLIIVVATGYTRQGTAIGFELLALLALMDRRPLRFVFWIAIAAGFHKSVAILLPLAYFAMPKQSAWITRFLAGITIVLTAFLIYRELTAEIDHFVTHYIESSRYSSQGALIRAMMSATAATVFILNWRAWGRIWGDRDIWLVISIAALALIPLTLISSTAADRMGLYLIPIQIIVFGRMPDLWRNSSDQRIIVTGIIAVYALTLFVWLHFGQFAAELWLPYKSLLFGEIS